MVTHVHICNFKSIRELEFEARRVNVFTKLDDFETKVDVVPKEKLPELLELNSDAFFNLDKLVHA